MRKSFIVILLFAFFSSPAWAISGFYRQAVRGKIQRQLPAVRTCYDNASEPKPKREATVVVRFDIDATGQVETAEIAHSDLKNTEVEDCLLRRMRRMKFPVPPAGEPVSTSYPFSFEPKKKAL